VWLLLDGEGNEGWKNTVPCHPDHITKTLERLPTPASDIQAAVEPISGWRWVSALLESAGIDVHPANSHKVRLIAESTQKHDLGDARTLANLLRLGYLPESYRIPDSIYSLRLVLRHRAYLVRLRVSIKNRLHGIATMQGLHHIARGNPLSRAAKANIMAGDNTSLKELHTLIEELDRRVTECDARCEEIAKTEPLVPILTTMPGIGIVSALTIIAEIGDFTVRCTDSRRPITWTPAQSNTPLNVEAERRFAPTTVRISRNSVRNGLEWVSELIGIRIFDLTQLALRCIEPARVRFERLADGSIARLPETAAINLLHGVSCDDAARK
jgi:hypothetical protein